MLLAVNPGPQAGSASLRDWRFHVPALGFLTNATHHGWSSFTTGCQSRQIWPVSYMTGKAGRESPFESLWRVSLQLCDAAQLFCHLSWWSMLAHHQLSHEGCAAVKACALSWTPFSFMFFPSLSGYIFKGHAGTKWNMSILPVVAPGSCWRRGISLWKRKGLGEGCKIPHWKHNCLGEKTQEEGEKII